MKIFPEKKDEVKIKVEIPEDLIILKDVLKPGDIVFGKTTRVIKKETKTERVPMFLGIVVEKVEFSQYGTLRILGKIIEGPENLITYGSYHTIEVKLGYEIIIKKEWEEWEIQRLREAIEISKSPEALIVCIEEDEAEIAILRKNGLEFLSPIYNKKSGKDEKSYEISMKEYFGEILRKIKDVIDKEKIDNIIICGPGFFKDIFFKFSKENDEELSKKFIIETVSMGSKSGIYELVKRGIVNKLLQRNRFVIENFLFEKFLEELSKNGLAAYGLEDVMEALRCGAVDKILVASSFVKNLPKEFFEISKETRAKIYIISNKEINKKVEAFGSICAILRFKYK